MRSNGLQWGFYRISLSTMGIVILLSCGNPNRAMENWPWNRLDVELLGAFISLWATGWTVVGHFWTEPFPSSSLNTMKRWPQSNPMNHNSCTWIWSIKPNKATKENQVYVLEEVNWSFTALYGWTSWAVCGSTLNWYTDSMAKDHPDQHLSGTHQGFFNFSVFSKVRLYKAF